MSSSPITNSRSPRKAFPAAVLQTSSHAVLGSCQPRCASDGHVGTDCCCTQGVMVGLGEEEGKEREREAGEEPSEPLSAVAVTAATPVGMGEGGGPAEKEEWGREEEEPLRSPAGRAASWAPTPTASSSARQRRVVREHAAHAHMPLGADSPATPASSKYSPPPESPPSPPPSGSARERRVLRGRFAG